MESLSESTWDVVICGTGLQQSLLALALSRSDKKILHVDPNEYYGGSDAAMSLQEIEAWASRFSESTSASGTVFGGASAAKSSDNGNDAESTGASKLSFPRAYSLALSPNLIYTRSRLLSQLVSSRAYHQLEFQAVGSFFVFQPSPPSSSGPSNQFPSLSRIPSTREDVFSNTAIPARSKRQLMKFLKFVLDYTDEEHAPVWKPSTESRLGDFLAGAPFKLDEELRRYVLALTLRLDAPSVTVAEGLEIIHRHLTSMGMFGPGFAAVYPKWGGSGETAQVACRAGAVGGGVYVLGIGIVGSKPAGDETEVELDNGVVVKTRLLVQAKEEGLEGGQQASRVIAVVSSPLPSLFDAVVEGAPPPSLAVVAFSQGSVPGIEGEPFPNPIYVTVHSSDTGECPMDQTLVYLTTLASPGSHQALDWALSSLLQVAATDVDGAKAKCLYKVRFEQLVNGSRPHPEPVVEGTTITFPPASASLSFDDAVLDGVKKVWEVVMGSAATEEGVEYMVFPEREGLGTQDDEDYCGI